MSSSNDPFVMIRCPNRIETINATQNYKKSQSKGIPFNTSPRPLRQRFETRLSCSQPFESHPHSYKYGTLPLFLPDRHSRHFRKKKKRISLPRSRELYVVKSSRASSRLRRRSHTSEPTICKIDRDARPGRGQWYTDLPTTAASVIGAKTHVFATKPHRPRSTAITTGRKNQSPRRPATSLATPRNRDGIVRGCVGRHTRESVLTDTVNILDGSSTARRYRKSCNIRDLDDDCSGTLSTISSSLLFNSNAGSGNATAGVTTRNLTGAHPMIPSILRIRPKTVFLDGATVGQSFTVSSRKTLFFFFFFFPFFFSYFFFLFFLFSFPILIWCGVRVVWPFMYCMLLN